MSMVGPRSHNKNPGGLFEGASFEIAETSSVRVDEALAAVRSFTEEYGVAPTAKSWRAAGMWPSEHTIWRRLGSFRSALAQASLAASKIANGDKW
jgi:hypothetical protein